MQTTSLQLVQSHAVEDAWRETLLGREDYVAGPDFEKTCYWKKHSNDFWHELMSILDAGQPFPITIVGRVVSRRLYMDTNGNYTGRYNQKLSHAKFQFTLAKPMDSPKFSQDWEIGLARIEQLENEISKGRPKKFLVISEDGERRIRMSSDMFALRTEPLSGYNEHDPTLQWPMPAEYMAALKATAPMYEIRPPRVYDSHDHRISPIGMQAYMNGSLAEVTFTMKQCTITQNEVEQSTFSGIFQQVRIIRRPPPANQNVYERSENQGPYIPRQIAERHRTQKSRTGQEVQPLINDGQTLSEDQHQGYTTANHNQDNKGTCPTSTSSLSSVSDEHNDNPYLDSDQNSDRNPSVDSNPTSLSAKALGKRKAADETDDTDSNGHTSKKTRSYIRK